MSGDQIPVLPGNARGMPGGGMLKLRFDWYIMLRKDGEQKMLNEYFDRV